ncbi:MAG: hypothetical protein H7Y60_17810 [Rhodospirillaceae bacterium]|nr:hypothetical protein [Rhodospirillales bacterium]
MTEHIQINDFTPRIIYTANGAQTSFTYPFPIFKAADLEVYLGAVKQVAGYTISGAGASDGGSITFTVAPAAATQVTLRRQLALARTSDYQADGIIRAKTLNDELDYQVAVSQQVAEEAGRAVKRSRTSPSTADLTLPEPVPGKALKWSDDGTSLINSGNDPDAAVDSLVALVAAADAAKDTAVDAAAAASADRLAADASAAASAASAAASATSAASVNMPSGVGHELNFPRQNATGTGFEFRTPAQVLSDIGAFTGEMPITAGEALSPLDVAYFDDNDQRGGGAGYVYKVDADAVGPVRIGRRLCIVLEVIASGASGRARVAAGLVTGFSGLIAGTSVYVSGAAGALTQTPTALPANGTQVASRCVGFAYSASSVWFDPEPTTLFVRLAEAATDGVGITVKLYTDSGVRDRTPSAYLVRSGAVVPGATGTAGGNMIGGGGVTSPYNGVTAKSNATCATRAATSGISIKDWGAGNTKTIASVTVNGANDGNSNGGYVTGSNPSVTINLRGSTDNFVSSNTVLGSITFADTDNESAGRVVTASILAAYRYTGTEVVAASGIQVNLAQVTYTEAVDVQEHLLVGSETINGGSTTMVTNKSGDTSGANKDTEHTFYPHLGLPVRDILVAVRC